PPALHAWIVVASGRSKARTYAWKAAEPQYAARNTTRGATAPRKIGRGGVPGGLTNTPAAPRRRITANQSASTPTMIGLMATPRCSMNLYCDLNLTCADLTKIPSRSTEDEVARGNLPDRFQTNDLKPPPGSTGRFHGSWGT